MIALEKFSPEEVSSLSQMVLKNVEKSDFEKYYLYTTDPIEKAKIFVNCYRFLVNLSNLQEGTVKSVLDEEIKSLSEKYTVISSLLDRLETVPKFIKFRIHRRLFLCIEGTRDIDNLIDAFSVLTERTQTVQVSRIKGFVLEGKSEKAYKKVFSSPKAPAEVAEKEQDLPELQDEQQTWGEDDGT